MNKAGLLGYAGNFNNNGIVALQVETASCIENMAEIAAVPGVDILFLGQNDLCMSMGLYNKYEFPQMYTSPELDAATKKLIEQARKEWSDPRTISVWSGEGWRVSGKRIYVYQPGQRSAPCADANGSVRERRWRKFPRKKGSRGSGVRRRCFSCPIDCFKGDAWIF